MAKKNVFRKLLGIIGLIVLFGGTLVMAHGLKGFEGINWDLLKKGGLAFLAGGLMVGFGGEEISKLIPMSEKQKKRNQAIDERILERQSERHQRRDNQNQINKQMRAQKAQNLQVKFKEKRYKKRRKTLEKRIDKQIKGQGFSPEEIQTVRSSLLDQFDDSLRYGPGKTVNHSFPAQLNIIVHPHAHQANLSWLGGNPSMPTNLKWPNIDGEPATFYAQIHCKDLPTGIWGGLGPKRGWLLFFCSRSNLGNVKVIHTNEIGAERPTPKAICLYDSYGSMRPHYNTITGDSSGLPPKWPLYVSAVDEEIHPNYRVFPSNNSDLQTWRQNFHMVPYDAPHMLPYDEATLRYFIQAFDEYLSLRVNRNEMKRYFPENEKLETLLTTHRTVQDHFTLLKIQTERALVQNGFYPELLNYFIEGLQKINTLGFWTTQANYSQPNLFQHEQPTRKFRRFLELYARMKYTENTSTLPEPHMSLFATLWDKVSKFEPAYMGGQINGCYPGLMTNPICLLELPSSSLLDWNFGDGDILGVFITAHDLKASRWDKAWGNVSN